MTEAADEPSEVDAALLATYLHGRDAACPFCDYNLRDLTSDTCPECGERIMIGVRAVSPKLAWPITGLIGLSAGGGFSLLMAIYFIVMITTRPFTPPRMWSVFSFTIILPLILQSLMIYLWLTRWNLIRRAPLPRRIKLALAACAVPIINIVIFTIYIK